MQISTKPQPAKKLIDASLPKNISAADKEALEKKWSDAAQKRKESIENETKTPTEPSATLRFQLRKFGHLWQSYYQGTNNKMIPILPSPSILNSALDVLTDKMADEALKS